MTPMKAKKSIKDNLMNLYDVSKILPVVHSEQLEMQFMLSVTWFIDFVVVHAESSEKFWFLPIVTTPSMRALWAYFWMW